LFTPLSISGYIFEWKLRDLIIIITGLYLLLIINFNKKIFIYSEIKKIDKIIFLSLLITILTSLTSIIKFPDSKLFIFASLIKNLEIYILYFFIRNNIYKLNDVLYLLKALIFTATIIFLIGIIEITFPDLYVKIIHFLHPYGRIFQENNLNIGWRISSVFLNSNKLGNFILIIFPLIFFMYIHVENKIEKLFLVILSYITVINLIFTLSREAWLGFILIFVYLFYTSLKYKIKLNIKVKLILFLIIVFIIIMDRYDILYKRMVEYTFGGEGIDYIYDAPSSASRIILWSASLRAIYHNWLLGSGPTTGEVKKYVPSWFITEGDPHNTFLRAFLETGLVGFIIFLNFIKELINFKNAKLKYNFDNYKYSIVASTIGLIISGLFGDSFQDFEVIVTLLIIVALLTNIRMK
jgi:O-antigen ligase